jgi:hypothetical protein
MGLATDNRAYPSSPTRRAVLPHTDGQPCSGGIWILRELYDDSQKGLEIGDSPLWIEKRDHRVKSSSMGSQTEWSVCTDRTVIDHARSRKPLPKAIPRHFGNHPSMQGGTFGISLCR